MGTGFGLGINTSEGFGADASERIINAPEDINFGADDIRGFTFDNVLHSKNDGAA